VQLVVVLFQPQVLLLVPQLFVCAEAKAGTKTRTKAVVATKVARAENIARSVIVVKIRY
jgi:hypothetical protein